MAEDKQQDASGAATPAPSKLAALKGLLARVLPLRAARGWIGAHRLRAGLIGAGGVVVLAMMVTVAYVVTQRSKAEQAEVDLAKSFEQLDADNYTQARKLARPLRNTRLLATEDWGGPVFVLGAVAVRQAESAWDPKEQSRLYLVAARYLEEARDRGFPKNRRAQGLFLLGTSLHNSGQYAQAVTVLKEALQANRNRQSAINRLLASAYFHDANPKLRHALDALEKHLADRVLSPDEQYRGSLLKSRILFRLGETDACRESLAAIPATASVRSEAIVMQGRLLMHLGDQLFADPELIAAGDNERRAAKQYAKAIDVFRQAQGRDTLGNQATKKSAYLIGVALTKQRKLRAAMEQFARTSRLYQSMPEGLAAAFAEAEVLQQLGEESRAIKGYRRVFRAAGEPRDFSNPWITLEEFHARMFEAHRAFLDEGKFDAAIQLARAFSPMFTKERATQVEAETYQAWAKDLYRRADESPEAKAISLRSQARRQLRKAGWMHSRLANYHKISRQYPEDLWNSANCYLQGRDYTQAVRMLQEYLKNRARERRPTALVGLGESYLALNEADKALESLTECIDFFPKDPATYQARLVGASAYLEKGETQRAKELLLDNLHNENLTPRSDQWRDSLFALGKLLFAEGDRLENRSQVQLDGSGSEKERLAELKKSNASFQEAIRRLSEAVKRYPNTPQAIEARYMIAESHRRAAKLPQQKLLSTTVETTRASLRKQIHSELAASLDAYAQLQQELGAVDPEELSEKEKRILRNCYFAQGTQLFELERYNEAIRAYLTATNRYQYEPIALEAYVQMAACHRRLGKPEEARGTLEQAKIVYKRIRSDANFARSTRSNRQQWPKLLEWMTSL